jgi:hypothetical protein
MMSETSRALLDAAREGLAPDAAVAARVRAKIAAATGVAAATGSVAALTVPKPSTAATLLKIAGALLVVGAVTTAVVVTRPERTTPRAPQLEVAPAESAEDVRTEIHVVAPNESRASAAAPPHHAAQPHHADSPHAADSPDTAPRSVTDGIAAPARDAQAAKSTRTHPADEDPFDSISLAREVELIDLAMVSLRKHVPHAALEAIKAYNRETGGRGQMAEDAAAIEIEARCLQDQDVTTLLDRFDHKWPESAQRERIQTTCFARK